ncbi:MAG: CBS domain-containing protein, partial [Gemmatimonadetes bacterium]|nr:CBS domain-containing protein [Gemmatimonadota bacterium]NIQ52553.1 CBS domain-containing protein [Gemmatimonadota bacterium]NIU72691.1 CBS domain-containing protein [Gammaproteobacteria bacterium]NIX43097.1 CBS domain-containing protein [Gemmatimonadota bacterium]NIY07259.1 CBS domain-containing protein [Gemmatimonadota bacterium]
MAGTRTRFVREVMATGLRTVTETASIDDAARMMERYGIRQVLVLDARGELAGLVSYRALL